MDKKLDKKGSAKKSASKKTTTTAKESKGVEKEGTTRKVRVKRVTEKKPIEKAVVEKKVDEKPAEKKPAEKKERGRKRAVKKDEPKNAMKEEAVVEAAAHDSRVNEVPLSSTEVVAETIESGNLGGETQEGEFIFLKHYSFIARYDNVQLANITLNNLKCVIYECDATSREDALNMFVDAIKDTGVSDVKRLFKKTFGEHIIVESGVLNNIEVERVSTDNINY